MGYPFKIKPQDLSSAEHMRLLIETSHKKQKAVVNPKKPVFQEKLELIQTAINARINKIQPSKDESQNITPSFKESEHEIKNQLSFLKPLRKSTYCSVFFEFGNLNIEEAKKKVSNLTKTASTGEGYLAAQDGIVANLKKNAGILLFMADHAAKEAHELLDAHNIDETAGRLDKLFNRKLNQISVDLQKAYEALRQSGLQDSDSVICNLIPLQIAKLLVTSDGQLNTGIISSIKKQFFSSKSPIKEWETGILRVLDKMNESWQKEIDLIVKPLNPTLPSNDLIRAELGLSLKEPITDWHAKVVAITGLLRQLNQGPVGDCFAIAWAIKKYEESCFKALQDYRDVLRDGCLTRDVNGAPDRFFFETTIADEDLFKRIKIDRKGTLYTINNYRQAIWSGAVSDAPNFIAAARQIGIDDLNEVSDKIMKKLFKNKSADAVYTTPQQILEFIAEIYTKKNLSGFDAAIARGKYGFSLTNNRLLRACETAMAGMAEARYGEGGFIRERVQDCIMKTLNSQWNKCKQSKGLEDVATIDKVRIAFQRTLDRSIRFIYNAAIPMGQVSSDGSSSQGGFELYQRDLNDPLQRGTRVELPEDLRRLLIDVVNLTERTLDKTLKDSANYLMHATAMAIRSYMQDNQFLIDVFHLYDPSSAKFQDPVTNYAKLEQTPMTTCEGNDPYEVLAIDTGFSFLPHIKSIQPKDPYALIQWILEMALWKEKTQGYLEDDLPDEIVPAASPQHAFNLVIEDPKMVAFIKSGKSSKDWILEKIIKPGTAIADSEISYETKLNYNKFVHTWLSDQFTDGTDSPFLKRFDQWAHTAEDKTFSVQEYAETLLSVITHVLGTDKETSYQISLVLDSILIQALQENLYKKMADTTMRFAKTNWNDRDENIYFCVYFNPRTKEVDFARINEDGTGLDPMDEYEWINKQTWEAIPMDFAEVVNK